MKTKKHRIAALVLALFAFLLCGCHKKNARMVQAEEKYKDYPLHLLALAKNQNYT